MIEIGYLIEGNIYILHNIFQRQIIHWISLSFGNVLFDSNKNEWNYSQCNLYQQINEKQHLLFVIQSLDNKIIGYYHENNNLNNNLNNSFLFKQKNENVLEKYCEITEKGFVKFNDENQQLLFLGGCTNSISLYKKEWKKYCKYFHWNEEKK